MTLKTLGYYVLLRIVLVEILPGPAKCQLCFLVQTCHFLALAHLSVVLTFPKACSYKCFLGRALENVAIVLRLLTQCPATWSVARALRVFVQTILVIPAGNALSVGNSRSLK